MPIGNLARKLSTVTRDPGILWRRSKSSALDLLWKHWPAKSRDRMLSTWQAEFARSAVDRALFPYFFARWIDEIYLVEADPDERERLKSLCMGGISGVAWADKYEAAPIDFEVYPWFGAFDKALEEAAPESAAIQIGCSSGREVAHFAHRHPRISFVGIDIDEAIILRASNVHPMPNLTFAVTRAHHVLDAAPDTDGELILFCSGSLQYVQPEHLSLMFARIARRDAVTIIVGDSWQETERHFGKHSQWRGTFSFSHNYGNYAREADLDLLEDRLIRTDSTPTMAYYMRARTSHPSPKIAPSGPTDAHPMVDASRTIGPPRKD